MRTRAARYPVWLGLLLSPAFAAAQSKTGTLPEAPKAAPAKPAEAKPAEKPAEKAAPEKPAEKATPAPEKPADKLATPPVKADKPAADVARGAGSRSVTPPAPPEKPAEPPPEAKKGTVPAPAGSHQKGRAPPRPAATLPPGAPRSTPDDAVRRIIAGGGPTDDDIQRGKGDPELQRLREAERVLFPRPLEGVRLGFDFMAPPKAGPEVEASGLPLGILRSNDAAPALAPSEASWLRGLVEPDLPVVYDERVVRYLRFYRDAPSGRSIARIWAKKAGRFGPAIKAELGRAGLPSDLVWLSLVESSHNPTIASPVGAAGLWQFMPDAARSYGLTVDRWVDERLDPERSTQAAVRHLSDLYRRYGSWDLAMAAYNMGFGGLSRAVRKYNTNSFWELARYEAGIPWETTLYVPKILATAVLMNNRRAFGLDGITEDPPERFDVVVVGPSVPLSDIARVVGSTAGSIEALNPHFLAGRTPPAAPGTPRGSYRVRVPEGSGSKWTPAQVSSDDGLEPYVVRTGETVERIARARGTNEKDLREKNRVAPGEVLAAGTVLLVPRQNRTAEPDPTTDSELVVVPMRSFDIPERKRVFYRVVSGDTVAGVALAFRVTARELSDWNTLDEKARLEPGMSLQVFVAKGTDLSKVLHIPEAHARILVAGSPEFSDYFEGQNGKKRLVIAAREGDTLSAIGKRYGMTVGQMERVNRRGRTDQIAAGDRIVVYTERTAVVPGDKLLTTASN